MSTSDGCLGGYQRFALANVSPDLVPPLPECTGVHQPCLLAGSGLDPGLSKEEESREADEDSGLPGPGTLDTLSSRHPSDEGLRSLGTSPLIGVHLDDNRSVTKSGEHPAELKITQMKARRLTP